MLISTQHAPGIDIDGMIKPDLIEHVIRPLLPAAVRRRRLRGALQPDRQLRARWPARRLRPDRAQDHRRHLRRHGPSRWRRVQRQGPDEGRPLRGVRGAPRGQERRGVRCREAVRGAGRLRDRCRPPGVGDGRDVRDLARSTRSSSRRWSRSTSTCARRRSSSGSTCAGRSTSGPRPTGTSAARSPTSPGSAPTTPTASVRPAKRWPDQASSGGDAGLSGSPGRPGPGSHLRLPRSRGDGRRRHRRHDRACRWPVAGCAVGWWRTTSSRRPRPTGCCRWPRWSAPGHRRTSSSSASGRRGVGPVRSRTSSAPPRRRTRSGAASVRSGAKRGR